MQNKFIFIFLFVSILIFGSALTSCNEDRVADINAYAGGTVILPWVTKTITSSMEPTINAGDTITIYSYPYAKLSTGMIVARFSIENKNYLIVHRIVKQNSNGTFRTKGDNNWREDEDDLTEKNYVGRIAKGGKNPDIGIIIAPKTP